jgi:hypothetical protein
MPVSKSNEPKTRREAREGDSMSCCRGRGHHRGFWGAAMVVVGFVWLARSLGWLRDIDIPLFPLLVIAGGVYLIMRSQDKRKDDKPS